MSHIQTGVATWFCCGHAYGPCSATGHGKCGTCNSGSIQHAWPVVTPGCDVHGCGRTLQAYSCGISQSIRNPCTAVTIRATIADCGPNMPLFCGDSKNDCAAYRDRIIDLTPAAFTALGVSLSAGKMSVTVTGVCICHPGCPC